MLQTSIISLVDSAPIICYDRYTSLVYLLIYRLVAYPEQL